MADAVVASPSVRPWLRHLPVLAVVVFAVVVAALTYNDFLAVHRTLWDNSTHDRNAHYLFALRVVTDLENFRVGRLLYDLYAQNVWPPLHGTLAGLAMLVGGRDYRVAVLPNLLAWVGTLVFAFLAVRRAAPRGGVLAGWVAVLFLAASPAHRAYATDLMLECLGACLTLAVLYAYLVAVQSESDSPWPGRWLALALTTLFLHKYNYWILCVLTIALTESLRRPRDYWQALRDTIGRVDWRAFLRAQVRSPLNYALAAVLLALAVIKLSRLEHINLFGREIAVNPPHTLITVAYALFFVRLVLWWRRRGRVEMQRFDRRYQQLIPWHVAPVAVWFLLPKHLSSFVWFLSPANSTEQQKTSLVQGLQFYWPHIVEEYHTAAWCALLAAALIVPAALLARRLRPGGIAILLLFALGLLLTATHPNHKGRYVHSWIALGWLSAGLGAAALVYGPLTARLAVVRPCLAAAALIALACGLLPALRTPAYAPEGGPQPTHLSLLDVTDCYLSELEQSRDATIVSAVPLKPMAQWTFLERKGELESLEKNWYGYGPLGDGNRQGFENWLQYNDAELRHADFRRSAAGTGRRLGTGSLCGAARGVTRSRHGGMQQAFRLVKQAAFPQHGCSGSSCWTRQQQQAAARRLISVRAGGRQRVRWVNIADHFAKR